MLPIHMANKFLIRFSNPTVCCYDFWRVGGGVGWDGGPFGLGWEAVGLLGWGDTDEDLWVVDGLVVDLFVGDADDPEVGGLVAGHAD